MIKNESHQIWVYIPQFLQSRISKILYEKRLGIIFALKHGAEAFTVEEAGEALRVNHLRCRVFESLAASLLYYPDGPYLPQCLINSLREVFLFSYWVKWFVTGIIFAASINFEAHWNYEESLQSWVASAAAGLSNFMKPTQI